MEHNVSSSNFLITWYDHLVKNKMAGLAVCVCGISMSVFLLGFAKIFSDFIYYSVAIIGLVVLATSAALFIYVSVKYVLLPVSAVISAENDPLPTRPNANPRKVSTNKRVRAAPETP